MSIEDKHSQRPTDSMSVPPGDELGEPTIIDERLGPGTSVGGYEIDDELGRGAMGVVYGATHPVIGKRVAIKVLRQHADAAAVERFILEARAANEIGHRNIVDIFDFGTLGDGRAYMVMDLLVGETLGNRIERGPLSLSDAAAITSECGAALAAAHAKSIVHRDLKPDNIFLVEIPNSKRVAVKLLDFGLVKLMKQDSAVRTKTGAVVGTADYMSPEQGRGRDVDHRTDIYALGVMLFQMLTGRLPYPRRSVLVALVAHAEEPVPSLQALLPSAPKQLAQLVEAMMAKDRYKRPNLTGIRAVLKKYKAADAPSEHTAIAAIPPVPASPSRTSAVGPHNMLDTLRGAGVGATPSKPAPAITPAAIAAREAELARELIDPEESRPTNEFVAVSTPVVSIPIGVAAAPLEPHDSGPIDPPTLIAPPLEVRVTPNQPATATPVPEAFVAAAPTDDTHIGAPIRVTAPLVVAPPRSEPVVVVPSSRPVAVVVEPPPMVQVPVGQFDAPGPGEAVTATSEIRRAPRWILPLIIILALGAVGLAIALLS
jgi:eukaryotic-like serine/threonine-protein kinase